jgi:hypothetical protein
MDKQHGKPMRRQSLTIASHFRVVYVYNPTDQRRIQLVKVLVDTHQVSISSNRQVIRTCQIDPKWTGKKSNQIETNMFEVCCLFVIECISIVYYRYDLVTYSC